MTHIGGEFFKKNKATWANTDTRLDHNVFLRANIDRQIATNALRRGGALKDLVSGATATNKIQDLKDLMGMQPIGRNRGPIGGKILKLLVYGAQQVHETQNKMGI